MARLNAKSAATALSSLFFLIHPTAQAGQDIPLFARIAELKTAPVAAGAPDFETFVKTCGAITTSAESDWQSCANGSLVWVNTICGIAAKNDKQTQSVLVRNSEYVILLAGVALGLGASSIPAAKAWGTFGGSTALGAFGSAISADAANLGSERISINSTVAAFQKTIGTPGITNQAIYRNAITTIGLCETAAAASTQMTPSGGAAAAVN